jgi:hypothetical protein
MDKINDGGPAFPNVPDGAGDKWASWDTGMTLRDYFAAKTMQAQMTAFWAMETSHGWSNEEIAREAYAIADAMLEARK